MRRNVTKVFDEYLVAAARTGDRRAFGELALAWQPKLLAHAYRLTGDHDMARDVTQDAWMHIVRGLPHLHDTATFPAWAYRIVTRRTADIIRRLQRQRRTNAAYEAEPRLAETSAAEAEAAADAGPLHKAMADLPAAQRAPVALHYIEGFSVAEIATVLEVPAGTIKTRLMHARKKLRAALEGEKNG